MIGIVVESFPDLVDFKAWVIVGDFEILGQLF
jgi:hypothetical protein